MGLTPILRELEEAGKNRAAAAAIAVHSRAEHMPVGTGPFSEHGASSYLCLYENALSRPLTARLWICTLYIV